MLLLLNDLLHTRIYFKKKVNKSESIRFFTKAAIMSNPALDLSDIIISRKEVVSG